jgi:arginase
VAVKIIRQPKKIALIGAPSSAAALSAGHEQAPAALRAAGFAGRLRAIGYEVNDLGDCATRAFQQDDEHPRARNVAAVLAALEDLRPRVEVAVKSGALPLILGGDCILALATVAGVRRYYRNVSLVYLDRDADLNVPATSQSGCVDGMVISHVAGRGAAELVRFWGEPPLVREPDIVLFGLERFDPPEEQALARSPIVRHLAAAISRRGAAGVARAALERVHAISHEFVLHLDVDVISSDDFRAATYAAPGGLRLAEVGEALEVFAAQENLAALEVTTYNPALDPDASQAKVLIELLAAALTARFAALAGAEASAEAPAAVAAASAPTAQAVPTEPVRVEPVPVEPAPVPVAETPEASPGTYEPAPQEPGVSEPALPEDACDAEAPEHPADSSEDEEEVDTGGESGGA